jgi:DNA-binding NarL/FixJ family response regulator
MGYAYYSNVPIRLLLVDPQPFFCEALACALAAGGTIDVVGWTTDELEASRLASARSADIVLTEVNLDSGSGLSLARRLRGAAKVVILTRAHEGDVLLDSVAAGAVGCLGHRLGVEALGRMLTRSDENGFVIDARRLHETLRRATAGRFERAASVSNLSRLTAREREVLRMLADGASDETVAERLYISVRTVQTHIAKILRKLELHSRADAARLALTSLDGAPAADVLLIQGPTLDR